MLQHLEAGNNVEILPTRWDIFKGTYHCISQPKFFLSILDCLLSGVYSINFKPSLFSQLSESTYATTDVEKFTTD